MAISGHSTIRATQLLGSLGYPSALGCEFFYPPSFYGLTADEQRERIELLLTRLADDLGLRGLSLLLAMQPDWMDVPMLKVAARAAADFGEAIALIARSCQIWERSIRFEFVDWRGDRPRIAVDAGQVETVGSQVLRESSLAALIQATRLMTRLPVNPRRVYFSHPRSCGTPELEEFFKASVRHSAGIDAIEFDPATLAMPMRQPDSATVAIVIKELDRLEQRLARVHTRFPNLVRAEVRARLGVDSVSACEVGRVLGVSERTLRRRLGESGSSYAAVVDSARVDRARVLLATTTHPITDIAFELGFANPGGLSRAFHRRVGETPSGYRERLRISSSMR